MQVASSISSFAVAVPLQHIPRPLPSEVVANLDGDGQEPYEFHQAAEFEVERLAWCFKVRCQGLYMVLVHV